MRKTVLFTLAALLTSAAVAQTGEITSAKGENWLSQDGDWGLTFDANPLLNYAGNLFNGNTNNGIGNGLTWVGTSYGVAPWMAIQGKKMVAADKAYRAKLRIGFGNMKDTDLVLSTDPDAAANTYVDDVTKNSNFNLVLGAGMEKRVGSTRVVGVYGAEAYVALGSSSTKYEYGNAASSDNPVQNRVTESKNGGTFGFGVGAFIGVEWFCAPKVSLSGEYTWGLMLRSVGHSSTTTESYVAADDAVETTTLDGGTKEFDFTLDTGVTGGSIGVNFYFQ